MATTSITLTKFMNMDFLILVINEVKRNEVVCKYAYGLVGHEDGGYFVKGHYFNSILVT